MVIIQEEKVLLLHQSVKNYLIEAREETRFSELAAHAHLAYRCIDLLIGKFCGSKKSNASLLAYATQNWPDHARMAKHEFEISNSQADFFAINSHCREYWLESYRDSETFFSWLPHRFSIFHVAARWGLPAILDHVSRSNDGIRNAGAIIHYVDCVDDSGATPLGWASKSGYVSVASALLDLGGKAAAEVTKAAAGSLGNSSELMGLLLDRRAHDIIITEEVLL